MAYKKWIYGMGFLLIMVPVWSCDEEPDQKKRRLNYEESFTSDMSESDTPRKNILTIIPPEIQRTWPSYTNSLKDYANWRLVNKSFYLMVTGLHKIGTVGLEHNPEKISFKGVFSLQTQSRFFKDYNAYPNTVPSSLFYNLINCLPVFVSSGVLSGYGQNLDPQKLYENRINYLVFNEKYSKEEMETVFNWPIISDIKIIEFFPNTINAEEIECIANRPQLTNLTTLNISRNAIYDDGVNTIANSPNFKNLKSLNLKYNGLTDAAAIEIANSSTLINLTSLDFEKNGITDEGVKAIANSPNFRNLKSLILGENGLTDAAAIEIVNSKILTKLTRLGLWRNNISAHCIEDLKKSNSLKKTRIKFK